MRTLSLRTLLGCLRHPLRMPHARRDHMDLIAKQQQRLRAQDAALDHAEVHRAAGGKQPGTEIKQPRIKKCLLQ